MVKVPPLALTSCMHTCARFNSVFNLTSLPWPSRDAEALISVSGHVLPARLPPQMGCGAQNRACGTLAPRAAQEASEGRKRHEIERSRRSPEAPGAAEARSGPRVRALEDPMFFTRYLHFIIITIIIFRHMAGLKGSKAAGDRGHWVREWAPARSARRYIWQMCQSAERAAAEALPAAHGHPLVPLVAGFTPMLAGPCHRANGAPSQGKRCERPAV